MTVYECINERRSIRLYKPDPVPAETLKRVFEVALKAPSWANKQCWKFIAVEARTARTIIGKATGQASVSGAFETAPCVIVLCADPGESGKKNYMEYYMFDCGLAMQSLMLAAAAEGLGTCVVGWFDEKAVRAVLSIPEKYRVVAVSPIGYPREKPGPRSRKKLGEVVFSNTWGNGLA